MRSVETPPRESGPGVERMGPEVEETAHFDHRQAAGGVGVCAIRGVVWEALL